MADGMTPGSVDPMFRKPQPGIGVNGPAPVAKPSIGVQGPGSIGTMAPHPDSPDAHAPHLPKWAADQVRGGGANPYHFVVNNGQLMKSLPQLGQPNSGGNDEPPAAPAPASQPAGQLQPAPANVPSLMPAKTEPTSATSAPIGIKAPGAQMRPGLRPNDPAREAMVAQLRYDTYQGDQSNVPNMAAGLAHYDTAQAHGVGAQAQFNSADPDKQFNLLKRIGDDPVAKGVYLGGKGVDPNLVPNPMQPGTPIGAQNMGQYLSQPQNAGLAGLIKDKGQGDLGEFLRAAQGVDGSADPKSQNNQTIQSHLRQRYAANPRQWTEDTYIPQDPDKTGLPGPVARIAGVGHAMNSALFGANSSGTGLDWRRNHEERSLLNRLLQQMKIGDPTAPR